MTNEELVRRYYDGDEQALELLYEQNRSFIVSIAEDAAKDFNCLQWSGDPKERYRNIIMAQDELCAKDAILQGKPCKKSRQKATRGKLERRTFYKLSVELASKLRQSEPLDYVDYV